MAYCSTHSGNLCTAGSSVTKKHELIRSRNHNSMTLGMFMVFKKIAAFNLEAPKARATASVLRPGSWKALSISATNR